MEGLAGGNVDEPVSARGVERLRTRIGRAFGGLNVRYKLMVLHNAFFLVLVAAVWYAVIPRAERIAAGDASQVTALKVALALTLAALYLLAVLTLELWFMRRYIYHPLRVLLDADAASRRGQTEKELIDESLILGDELGQLMGSRNATVRELRRQNFLLETAKRNIADQDRLASLGLLSASIAHELNTPLAVLRGSIEQLLESPDGAASRERLERMLRVTERLRRMSDSLVDFSRVRNEQMEPLLIRPLIDEAWSLVAIDGKAAGVRFENQADERAAIVGNRDRLVQLFLNLLRNALHAVGADGQIGVETRRTSGYGLANVFVAVVDNGPGIPPDVLPEIFEAFVTTRLDARGTGLGLTVAEGIAHQHGGAITATNRPEGGACLEVRLPAAPPDASADRAASTAHGEER